MFCTINKINLSFDENKKIENALNRAANSDKLKYYTLGSILNDEQFINYIKSVFNDSYLLKGETINFDNFTNKDYLKFNSNKLIKIFNDYYKTIYKSVNNTTTKKGLESLNGFTSHNAQNLARDYVACRLIDIYRGELLQGNRSNKLDVVEKVIRDITIDFYNNVVTPFATDIYKNNYSREAKSKAIDYLNVNSKIKSNDDTIKAKEKQIENKEKQIQDIEFIGSNNDSTLNGIKEEAKKGKITIEEAKAKINEIGNNNKALVKEIKQLRKEINTIKEELKSIKEEANNLELNRYVLAQNLVNDFAKETNDFRATTMINFSNMITQMRGNTDEFFFRVFNTKRMSEIVRDFDNIGSISEQIEIEDDETSDLEVDYNGETVDESTKTWEDSVYRSFTDSVNAAMKIAISSLPNLASPYDNMSNTQVIDTNNELGVKTYMDMRFVINQIKACGNFNSVEDLIRKLDERSTACRELYGLGTLVNRMKNVPEFANAVFVNFAKPVVHKVMMDFISKSEFLANDNFAFNYTNQNAFTDLNLFYKILQKLRISSYHEGDTDIISTLKDRLSLLRNRESKGFIRDGIIHFISDTNPDLNYEDFINETLRLGYEIFNKYLPGVSFEAIERYCKTNDAKETILRVSDFCSTAESIVDGMKKYKEKIKEEEDRVGAINKNRWAAYEESRKKAEKTKDWSNVVPFEKELVDYSKINLDSQFITSLFDTAKYLNKHLPANIKLNSTNAEGNSASDIIKNCYVSRLFEVIDSFNEEKQKTINNGYNMSAHEGLIALRDYVDKDGEQGQYANNPIFWGVTNLDGKVIRQGMFNRTGVTIGYNNKIENSNINRDANDIIGYSLFDGSRNPFTDDGNTYASMSKVDFFLTQYIAYSRSIMSYNNEKYNPNPGMDSALYSMRIGSDAPKIFFIRAPKYNKEELDYCFLGHLLDEINMFSKGINSLFVNENGTYITRKDIKGLFGRAFFDEEEARNIRQNDDKVKDYTTAIVKDGKLVGNLFSFNRLFKIGNYNAGEEIANALSLYGRADDSLFVKNGNRLEINPKRIQDGTITIDENNGKLSFNVTREIKEKLLDIVKTWEKEYLKDSYIRLRPYEQYLEKIGYSSPNMDGFILNTANMNMCYDDLFEGDFKFYKDSRDFLKRTKETQAGGDGYAGYNINNILDETIVTNQRNGKDETIKVKQQKDTYTEVFEAKDYVTTIWKDGRLQEAPLESRSGFRAITIYNTVKSADEAPDLQRKLEQVFKDKGLSDEKAKEKSVEIASGYFKPTKTNDAQSYITIEEFIRRRYLDGTLDQYQDLLAQILDPNVAAEDINISGINARIQVQKNFYYDKIYDANTGLYYSRQIKNAEFVLIPKLLPKDSQLRKIYDFMKKNDINQLNTAETSKAANKDIFTIWDEKTGEFNEDFEKNFDNSYIENYSYAYLYKQQEVQEHSIDKTNKAGSQFVKKILDNCDTAKNPEVKKWCDDFVDSYTANIEESFYNVLDKFGWTYDEETKKIINANYRTTDENGEPLSKDIIERNKQEIDFEYFWRRFIEESARLGMDSNYMDYVVPDENGIPKMPTFMNLSNAKLQSIANSIFSRAIARQTLPGWHGAQITGVGYSKKLKFDANTGIMEVYLPRWSKLIPKGKNAEEEAAILKQIQEAGLDIQIGYRIPTEGKQSISVLRVVGFTNECLGSTIVVPDAWVTQTGSDFDVDSIYGICWEMYKTSKNGNVELHKIEYEEGKTDDKQLYIKYVNNKLENKVRKDKFGNEIDDNIKKLKDELNNKDKRRELDADFQKYDKKRNELFNSLHIRVKRTIATENKNMNRKAKKDKVAVDLIELYDRINSKLDKLLDNAEKHKFTEEDIANIKEYQDYLTALIDIMKNQDGIPSFDKAVYKSEKAKIIENAVEEAKEKYFNKIKDAAKEAGLMSFDEFTKLPHVKKLDTRARNNYILDRSIKIMNDDSTREEQYSRSQFEDLSKANKLIDKLYNIDKNSQSPYNIFDQLDYFEDVMGGRRLKAISVMWDSFISRNNRIKTKLNPRIAINVWLNEDGKASEYYDHTYDVEELKKNYTTEEIDFIKKETFDDFVNYSSNEVGADETWRNIGKRYGLKYNADINFSSITIHNQQEVENAYNQVSNIMKREAININAINGLRARDAGLARASYLQAKNADTIFVVGEFVKPKEKGREYINESNIPLVDGYSGYIVEFAKLMNKPLYVFDQKVGKWVTYNYEAKKYVLCNTPILTKNFAGVGTRYINEQGKKAIEDVIKSTKEIYENNEQFEQDIDKLIGIGNAEDTINTLNSDNSELSDIEREELNKVAGKRPKVLVASEASDPVFFSDQICNMVNRELAKSPKDRTFHCMYLITKHDGIPFKNIAKLKIPKFIHFSITSLGGTKYEPGVMKMDDLLDRIEELISNKTIDPNKVTIRIDPIIPGVTKDEDIRHIIERATKMGIRQFKFSIMDSYGNTQNTDNDKFIIQKMKELGYDWNKYYYLNSDNKYSFNAKFEYIKHYFELMDNLAEEFNIFMNTCAEAPNIPLKRIKTKLGCINVNAINQILGRNDEDTEFVKGNQRPNCTCYGNIRDVLSYNSNCASGCIYCYAKHNSNIAMRYYDANGNLLENRFTRTVEKMTTNSNNKQNNTNTENNSTNKFSLRAAEFGWSKSNENIDGKLITAYAAQTTAHHLDAVKEGSIQNVNEYTFGVYKLLTAIGLDFTHAIAFIRQPIITELVRYNNLKNSIYSDKSIKPIAMTLQSIAERFGINIDDKYAFTNSILKKIISNVKVQKYIRNNYNVDIKYSTPSELINNDFPIILDRLLDRIANYNNNEKSDEKLTEDTVDDLVNLLIFYKLQNIANRINKLINAANIDKEGTKISIFETRVDLDNIEELRNDDTLVDDSGKTFANKVFNNNSAYKQLNAIYEFVTKQSVDVNSRIFKTESDDFFEYQKNINKLLQHKFNAKEHQELIKYMVGYMYNQIPALINPVSLDENGNIVIDYDIDDSTYNKERSRIFGYGVYGDGNIVIRDVNNPTKEEIEDYKALTPAQKVIFIQNNFSDSGLFGELHVTSSRASDIKKKGINRQFIYYSDGVNNEENYYDMFVNVFSNKNPLIKLAAIDLIKYAFIAETHTFRPGNISRIISNKVLYANREDGGMDLIKDLNKYFNVLLDVCYAQKFTDSFVRSHSNLVKSYNIFNRNMDYNINGKLSQEGELSGRKLSQDEKIYYMQKARNGVLFANVADDLGQLLLKRFDLFNNVDGYLTLISNYGRTLYRIKAANPIYEEYKAENEETNNTEDNTTENNVEENNNENEETEKVLIGYQYYMLIPLNMLDNNEYSEYSYNIRNNKFADPEVYSSIFEDLVKNSASTRMTRQQQTNIQQIEAVEQYAKEDDYNLLLDRDGLTTIANNVESKLQAQAKKLVDGIAEKIDSESLMYFNNDVYLQYNPGFELRKIMPKIGVTITQDINTKTQGVVTVDITRIDFSKVTNPTNEEYKKVNDELERNVISKYTAPVYKVVKHVNTDEENKTIVRNANTELLLNEDEDIGRFNLTSNINDVDRVSAALIHDIKYKAIKNKNTMAESIISNISKHNINVNSLESLKENRTNLYKTLSRFYRSAANDLLHTLNHYELAGVEYSMGDANFYEALKDNNEKFPEVSNIILDCITFGKNVEDIFNLDIATVDKETAKSIEEIRNAINSIRNNNILSNAMNNMFNIYMKQYSTNPEILENLMELRETYGDIDTIVEWIHNPTEIQNNEVQVILKKVNEILAKAQIFDATNNLKDYQEKVNKIKEMSGDLNLNNIIDFDTFSIKQGFNDKYLDDYYKILEDLNTARIKGTNTREYIDAKFKKDEFMYKHTHQPIIDDYYREKLANEREAMENGGDTYYEYLMLSNELYNMKDDNVLTEEERQRKQTIKTKLNFLRSELDYTGEVKQHNKLKETQALNKFIKNRKDINAKYFNKKEYDGFTETYNNYKEYIDYYNAQYPHKTLLEKLENSRYREAYEWIKDNGSIGFTKDVSDTIARCFQILTGSKSYLSNIELAIIRNNADYLDNNGILDARKLTDEQLQTIMNNQDSVYNYIYDSGLGDGMLYKLIPNNLPVMISNSRGLNNDALAKFNEIMTDVNNRNKFRIYKDINAIIGKCIDINNGTFSYDKFFNDNIVSQEERDNLKQLYNELKTIYDPTKLFADGRYTEFRMYDRAINEAKAFYNSLPVNSNEAKDFREIFGSNNNFNVYIYGYVVPKGPFIDTIKTAARQYMNRNLKFVPTEYYYEARQEAINNGTFDEWYKKNHIYNPYEHKYEPLKVWTTLAAKEDGDLINKVVYNPRFDNMESSVKDEYKNPNYHKFSKNYKRGDSYYDSNITLNPKEEAYKRLLEETLNKYTTNYYGQQFIGKGYLPRVRQNLHDIAWGFNQVGNLLGFNYHSATESDTWYSDKIDYNHDREYNMGMLNLIKTKASKKFKHLPKRLDEETDEQYAKRVSDVREENREIQKHNLAIDNALINKDVEKVMEDFVYNATIFNAKQTIKPYLYLLLEDLKRNEAVSLKGFWNKTPISNNKTERQTRTIAMIENLTRRLVYDQYHASGKLRNFANLLQNIASAKYMVFNLYGGIANIATGKVNIGMEESANEFFGFKEFQAAEKQYLLALPNILATAYKEKSDNITTALIKKFNVVEIDNFIMDSAGAESLDEKLKRIRDFSYIAQSGGEHYMQNSVLLAMLKTNKLDTDDERGPRIIDFKDYVSNIEIKAMRAALSEDAELLNLYNTFINNIKNNKRLKYDISSGRKTINSIFLNNVKYSDNNKFKSISNKYTKIREDMLKDAKDKFNGKKSIESLFTVKNGEAVFTDEAINILNEYYRNKDGEHYNDTKGREKLESLMAGFKIKVEEVNKYIHGVYDKNGAAMLENTWWGSLLAQYHKHLPTGIFKRWRRHGYYSEIRQAKTRGSYQSFIDFLSIEFMDFKNRKNKRVNEGTNECLASIQTAIESAINTFINYKLNKNNLDLWQQANIRRNTAEIRNVFICCLLLGLLYGGWDDDEINDDYTLSSALYCIDRLYSETTMYSPLGLVSEYKTAWSSPIAGSNGVSDLFKAAMIITNNFVDPTFDTEYTTGQYKHQNKLAVLAYRNAPGVRAYNRIMNITNNNKYYKVGESQIGMKLTKNFVETMKD